MGLYFLCSKNIGADQLRSYCKTAKGSFVRTRFYLTRVLFLSAPLIMQKGVKITIWLVGISERKCVRLVSCIDVIINFMTLRCQNKMGRAIRKSAVCLDVKKKALISCTVTAQSINFFVSALSIIILYFLSLLNPKFRASSRILNSFCFGRDWKSRRQVF